MTLAQMLNNITIHTDVLMVVAGENEDYSWLENETFWELYNWDSRLECESFPEIPDEIMDSTVIEIFNYPSAKNHVDPTLVIFVAPGKGFHAEKYWKECRKEGN